MGNQGCVFFILHVWVQELIGFWYQSLLLFCTWLCMQSILMSTCAVYLPYPEHAKHHYGTASLCDSHLSLFCRFDQPESIFFAFAASHHRLARLCETEPKFRDCLSFRNKNTHRNDHKFGCFVIIFRMMTIWVHMEVLVWRTICFQAVVFIWIVWASQTRPSVAEFHHIP